MDISRCHPKESDLDALGLSSSLIITVRALAFERAGDARVYLEAFQILGQNRRREAFFVQNTWVGSRENKWLEGITGGQASAVSYSSTAQRAVIGGKMHGQGSLSTTLGVVQECAGRNLPTFHAGWSLAA